MIQASLKKILLMALVAVTANSGQLFADAPEGTSPSGTEQAIHNRLQQVGHQADSDIQQVQCVTEGCTNHSKCRKCKKCKSCDSNCYECRPTLWDRIRGRFWARKCTTGRIGQFNVHCDQCRRLGRHCGRCQQGGAFRNGRWVPNGCGGKGCPPFGVYQMVYPVNPQYCDGRDRAVHAAQGYNVPMSVPLAPVVRHQYNYSWGVPASRLTPISNYAPYGLHGHGYGHPGAMPSSYCPSCQKTAP